MRKILFVLLLCTCFSVYPQNRFADIKDEVNKWMLTNGTGTKENNKAPKSIDFTTQKYSINGIIAKGILCEGTTAKFYGTASLVPNLLLEGKVSYRAGRLVIDGVRYGTTKFGTNKTYGSFFVYNMDDFSFNYKPKKAGALRIKLDKASYWEGFYRERPVIVKMGQNGTVYLGKRNDPKSFIYLSAPIPNVSIDDVDSLNIEEILLQVKDNVTMCWENEVMFKGSVKPTPNEDNLIAFLFLEGQMTRITNATDHASSTSVRHENGNIVYSQIYDNDHPNLSKASYLAIYDETIPMYEYWKFEKMLESCYLAKWTYKNGAFFEGKIKYTVTPDSTISTTLTEGVLTYPNGDKFEGNLSTKLVGPFFVDGTTYFEDGSKSKGNWLADFQMSDKQWERVYACSNPSEAKALAQRIVYNNNYPVYKYPESIEYFNPTEERINFTYADRIIYDKAKNRYKCNYSRNRETVLEFAVDNKGQRKWEIVYENNKPKYINEYTWYVNGVIESIRCYSYGTKKIYLSCFLFSDGKLRSAYQYGIGNNGENVLRKSKESHPTYGGYSSKLYDLNGNFERSIEWKIGTRESIWGTHDEKIELKQFFPDRLTPIEDM